MTTIPKIVSVEGNIGVGKTTMLDNIEFYIRKNGITDIVVMREPIEKWTSPDKSGTSILEKFYKDKQKYTFSFQVFVLLTIIDAIKHIIRENPTCKLIICERSLSASRYVFADMLHAENVFDTTQYEIYCKLYDEISANYVATQTIYLSCPLTIIKDRIHKRNRSGEEYVTMEYLEKCEEYYNKLIVKTEIPHIHIDVSKDILSTSIEEHSMQYNKWIREIMCFVLYDFE
jgi:deoxyadenosine/deoxycytidine kinase